MLVQTPEFSSRPFKPTFFWLAAHRNQNELVRASVFTASGSGISSAAEISALVICSLTDIIQNLEWEKNALKLSFLINMTTNSLHYVVQPVQQIWSQKPNMVQPKYWQNQNHWEMSWLLHPSVINGWCCDFSYATLSVLVIVDVLLCDNRHTIPEKSGGENCFFLHSRLVSRLCGA